jgi:hypothetical protein
MEMSGSDQDEEEPTSHVQSATSLFSGVMTEEETVLLRHMVDRSFIGSLGTSHMNKT